MFRSSGIAARHLSHSAARRHFYAIASSRWRSRRLPRRRNGRHDAAVMDYFRLNISHPL
jgi:hypothetical protein